MSLQKLLWFLIYAFGDQSLLFFFDDRREIWVILRMTCICPWAYTLEKYVSHYHNEVYKEVDDDFQF